MDIPNVSSNGLVTLAQALQRLQFRQEVATAALKLANDQARQAGEAELKLIESAGETLGQNVDVRA